MSCPRLRPADAAAWTRLASQLCAALVVYCIAIISTAGEATALEPIVVKPDQDRIEITTRGVFFDNRGDSLQIETAPSSDGVVGRMSVRAQTNGTNPNWIVFALTNPSDKDIERWVTSDRYRIVGSGAVWPDLDASRIEAVTPSIGYLPERIKSDRADVFRVTLEPGQTITFVAELSTERFSRIFLWKPLAYELKVRERQLFNGIMLGLTGLLAIFLTVIFAANHKAIFPSAALVGWCVLAYLCIDFGFFHKLFNLRPEDNAVYRAAAEASMAASLVIFLHTFLRLGLAHGILRMLLGVWILAQLALVAVAVVDPRLASTFARLSFVLIGGVGAIVTLFLAVRGQDRALSLIPTWLLFLVWVFALSMTLTGRLTGEVVVAGLVAGLVLIVVLIGFTVTQFAFRSMEPIYGAAPTELQLRSLAVDGAGAATWEWNARRDEVKVSPVVEASLGLNGGDLSCKVEDFSRHVHPADRERFRLTLWSVQERSGGRIHIDFRLRHADNSYRWFELEAASVETAERRNVRCVGLLRDITDSKRARERLLQDAVNCSLTGLPNRELFLDRLGVATRRAAAEDGVRPTVIVIDIDKFKSVNSSYGIVVGDTLLLTIARRLQRHLGDQDTLSRIGGDQFAILLMGHQDARELAGLAERIRRSLRSQITIAGQAITLTGSLGIAVYDGVQETHLDLLKEAELAMYRAKRSGADRIEIFRPEMRGEQDNRVQIESELRRAIDEDQIKVLFQPIVYLPTEELAGFEALVRWEHPTKGLLNPASFIPVAEESDLIVKLGSHVLIKAAETASFWHKELPRNDGDGPLFVSVNISSRQLLQQDLIQEVRHIIGGSVIPKGALRLEVTESLMMENPEKAIELLEQLRGAGAEIAIDDFGTGYSSLSYLQRFPFDTIKIDKMLVQSTSEDDGAGSAIVRSVVALAHELGKKVVAEGVEQPDDVSFLRSINCEYAQGFYYGEAMPQSEVLQLLRIIRKSESRLEARGFFRTKAKPKKTTKRKSGKPQAAEATDAIMPDVAAAAAANGANGANGAHKPSQRGPSHAATGNGSRANGSGEGRGGVTGPGSNSGAMHGNGHAGPANGPPGSPSGSVPSPAAGAANGSVSGAGTRRMPVQPPANGPSRPDVPRTVATLPNSTVRPLNRPAPPIENPSTEPKGNPGGALPPQHGKPPPPPTMTPPTNSPLPPGSARLRAGAPASGSAARPGNGPLGNGANAGGLPPAIPGLPQPPHAPQTPVPAGSAPGAHLSARPGVPPDGSSQAQPPRPPQPQPVERNASEPPSTGKRPSETTGISGLSLSQIRPVTATPRTDSPQSPPSGDQPTQPLRQAGRPGGSDLPDLSKLPPGIAASLAKLAGKPSQRGAGSAGRPVGGAAGAPGNSASGAEGEPPHGDAPPSPKRKSG